VGTELSNPGSNILDIDRTVAETMRAADFPTKQFGFPPAGRLRLALGRRAGIATLMWVCALFLTVDYLVAPGSHDVLGMSPTQTGWALTAGGIGWSVVAIACGARPASEPDAYRRRTAAAAVFFTLGIVVMIVAVTGYLGWWALPLGYGVASIGMGLTHLDTMNRIVTDPARVTSSRYWMTM